MSMHILDVVEWPAARDVARRFDVSPSYVSRLIRSGRLRVVQTRLGCLVDPESVREFAELRATRKAVQA